MKDCLTEDGLAVMKGHRVISLCFFLVHKTQANNGCSHSSSSTIVGACPKARPLC